jgi:acetylglutamate kinase
LTDINDENSVIQKLSWDYYQALKSPLQGMGASKIFAGMIPKLDNAFAAITCGVKKVIIGKAEQLKELMNGEAGTNILNE